LRSGQMSGKCFIVDFAARLQQATSYEHKQQQCAQLAQNEFLWDLHTLNSKISANNSKKKQQATTKRKNTRKNTKDP